MRQQIRELLDRVLLTHSPGGWEQEMNAIVREELGRCNANVQCDPHDNIYVVFPGRESDRLSLVTAHKDENSLIVRKIDEDGKMWLDPIGGTRPTRFGEGPFDLITESEVIPGILHMGSTHSSELSGRIYKTKTQLLTWDMVYLDCKLDAGQLAQRGVGVGDRALVSRTRKTPTYLHDEYVAGYALDDKAAVAVLLLVARALAAEPPAHDVCVGITSAEEGGVSGGKYLCRTLQPHDFIAVEVGPVADEYPIQMNDQPVVLFKDGSYHYDHVLSRELIAAGTRQDIQCQRAVIRSFGSDSSLSAQHGLVGRPACICFPTENTHGYEVSTLGALENCVKILVEHFTNPGR